MLVLDLIQSGIRVVQLLPVETVYDEKTNPMARYLAAGANKTHGRPSTTADRRDSARGRNESHFAVGHREASRSWG